MIRTAFYVTVAIGLAGCGPVSQLRVSLIDPNEAVDARTLTGVYALRQDEGRVSYLHIGSASKDYPANFLTVAWVADDSPEGLGAITWPAFSWTTNQTHILHFPLPEELDRLRLDKPGDFWSKSWGNTKVTGYALLQVRKTDEGLAIAGMREEFWASEIESGKLQGSVASYDLPTKRISVDVTSARSDLQNFLETHPDEAFDENPTILRRLAIE